MSERTPALDPAFAPRPESVTRLDYSFLLKVFLGLGILLAMLSPFTRDPVAFAIGGMVPALAMWLIGRPTMPAAVIYLVLWQWAQTFSRVLQTLADGEALGGGLYGPNVERAYWYMLASVVTLALAFRLVLGRLPPPTPESRLAHTRWQPSDLVLVYLGTTVLSLMARFASSLASGLDQPMQSLQYLKVLALFLMFTSVMMTGKGGKFALIVFLFEVLSGFTGILSDFKAVFIQFAIAALAVRIRWTAMMGIMSVVWLAVLMTLALFWTGVKMEYRQVATGSDESQEIRSSLSDRLGYLGGRALSPDSIDWGESAYALLIRFAYVDIFGSVIGVQENSPQSGTMRQWSDAISHVTQPRFLFPDKPVLSDTEVYVRLAKGDSTERMREGTSISVGYMAENFVDLGFPGMLAGILVIGLLQAGVCRYFMTRKLPWMVREGTVLVFIYSIARDGVEMSMPKMIGAILMFFLVYTLLVRFGYPHLLAWLDRRAATPRQAVSRAGT
jgi:hypothetical protein